MESTSDFEKWIQGIELENYEEVYFLYTAVKECTSYGGFTCTEKELSTGSQFFVKCDYVDELLLLLSEKARQAFLSKLEKENAGDITIEAWYDFKRALEKND
jgi:hypothetical protein